jgi:glycosyltransferase involved in cell wall biosynthesis
LTVLNVAYSLAAVSPDAAGGAEQILAMLDAGLTREGHRSIVVAAEGSAVAGTLVPVPRRDGALTSADWHDAHQHHRRAIAQALERYPVQVVHFHGIDFLNYLPAVPVPALATLHLPVAWYRPELFTLRLPQLHLHCVSRAQRLECPEHVQLEPEIENGIPVDQFRVGESKREYVLALGRICPEKGFHLAIEAARQAGCPFRLAGQVFCYEAHRRYFEEEIVSRLDEDRRYIGPVGFALKVRLLAGARCLLIPSLTQETSSLVAMEALAAGTPVVAFRTRALTDILDHGVTGFLVDDVASMAAAIPCAAELDPEVCRRVARARFSEDRMIASYLDCYWRLAA